MALRALRDKHGSAAPLSGNYLTRHLKRMCRKMTRGRAHLPRLVVLERASKQLRVSMEREWSISELLTVGLYDRLLVGRGSVYRDSSAMSISTDNFLPLQIRSILVNT